MIHPLVRTALALTASAEPAPTDAAACPGLGAEQISVTVGGARIESLVDELTLRVPCAVEAGKGNESSASLDARFDRGGYEVELTLPDGRVYRETGDVPAEIAPERVAASDVAALIGAIERGERREDEVVEVHGTAAPNETDDPDDPVEPAPTPKPATPPTTTTRRWELGGALTLGSTLAAGPPGFADTYLGSGAELAFDARAPGPLRLWFGVRPWGRSARAHSLFRTRFAVGVGAGRTLEHFQLLAVVGPIVEVLAARSPSGGGGLSSEGRRVPPTAVGGALRLYGAGRWHRGALHVEIGPVLDLQASTIPFNGGTVAALRSTDGRPLSRVGGLEITGGLQVGLYWSIGS